MKKWLEEQIEKSGLWFSYYPNIFTLSLNAGIMVFNLYYPAKFQWLNNCLILAGSIGIAWSLRGIYGVYVYRKEQIQYRRSMDEFMMSLKSAMERIIQEEMTVEDRDETESMSVARNRICELIQSEADRRKIGLTVSNPDKT